MRALWLSKGALWRSQEALWLCGEDLGRLRGGATRLWQALGNAPKKVPMRVRPVPGEGKGRGLFTNS